jgi:DNA-binding NarL/FixJ family response regulator
VQSTGAIRVILIEDHGMVADALAASLGAFDDIEVVEIITQASLLDRFLAGSHDVDAVLLDLRLADGVDGLTLVPILRKRMPGVKIVVLSAWSDESSIRRSLEAGCDGYLLKEQSIADLANGVRAVVNGEPAFAPQVTRYFLGLVEEQQQHTQRLSKTETIVLQHIARGLSSAEIADELFLSVNTVRNHAQHILKKMDVRSRSAAVAAGARAGIIRL